MKILLTTTAIIESGAGLVLIAMPSLLSGILFGVALETPVALTVARMAGAAVLSLAVACWFARNDRQGHVAKGLVSAMLLYNTAIAIVLAYAAIGLMLAGISLWPAVLLHLVFSGWCAIELLNKPLQSSAK